MNKTAFTLAEVIIVLGIIGTVAAITLPMLSTNITERKTSERQANVAQKVTKAMENMRANGKLTQYESTESFVDEFKKHIKVAKVCDNGHLTDCWSTSYVKGNDGEQYSVADAKKGKDIGLNTDTNNMGLILADGTPIILNYDNTARGLDIGDRVIASNKSLPVGNGKTKEFPYTTSSTNGLDFIMDLNGKKGPNSETTNTNKISDIRPFKLANFSGCPGFTVPGLGCVVNIGTTYEPVDEEYVLTCPAYGQVCTYTIGVGGSCYTDYDNVIGYEDETQTRKNYLEGAKNKCASINNMHLATTSDMETIYNYIGKISGAPNYGDSFMDAGYPPIGMLVGGCTTNAPLDYNVSTFTKSGITKSGMSMWHPYQALCVK